MQISEVCRNLQEVKKEVKGLYSTTDIKGDGQVVAISFTDGVIELVPGFEQSDGNYKYPDSNNGGSWKITKPVPEQEEAIKMRAKILYLQGKVTTDAQTINGANHEK